MQSTEEYLKNKKQTAKFLGVSVGSLERLMRSDPGISYCKIGGLVRFRPEDIAAYVASRRVHSPREGEAA